MCRGAAVPETQVQAASEEEAIKEWNKRPTETGTDDPLITNEQLKELLGRARGMDKTHRDTMWEALIFVRGTYEREREELKYDRGEMIKEMIEKDEKIRQLESKLAGTRVVMSSAMQEAVEARSELAQALLRLIEVYDLLDDKARYKQLTGSEREK
jgi:hypothetical protein